MLGRQAGNGSLVTASNPLPEGRGADKEGEA